MGLRANRCGSQRRVLSSRRQHSQWAGERAGSRRQHALKGHVIQHGSSPGRQSSTKAPSVAWVGTVGDGSILLAQILARVDPLCEGGTKVDGCRSGPAHIAHAEPQGLGLSSDH